MKPVCSVTGCANPSHSQGLCGSHYQRKRVSGDVNADVPIGVGKKLSWLRANCQPDHNECVLWPFSIGQNGYGTVFNSYSAIGAHVEACTIANGPKPSPDLHAAHSCGNRACVNSHHLRWATPKENASDKKIHGTYLAGESAPQSKLTNEQARKITEEKGTQREIAARYGVTQRVIGLIKEGKTYKSALGMS